MLVDEIRFELLEQAIALGSFVFALNRIWKYMALLKPAPEQIFNKSHLRRLRTHHCFDILNHLSISSRNILQVRQTGVGHGNLNFIPVSSTGR